MKQLSRRSYTVLLVAGCAALLAIFLLLPLVNMMSYHWTLADLGHKLPRLVHSGAVRVIAFLLLAGMLLTPVWLVLKTCIRFHASKVERLLPAACALVTAIALMVTSSPLSPGLGLWLYLAVALAVAAISPSH